MLKRSRSSWLMFVLALCCAGCELLADFDRDKIPHAARDAAVYTTPDAASEPDRQDAGDGGDGRGPRDGGGASDAGPGVDEDAGR